MIILVFVICLLCICSMLNKQAVSLAHPFTVQWMQAVVSTICLPIWYFLSKKFAPSSNFSWEVFTYASLASLGSAIGFVLFLNVLKEKPVSVAVAFLATHPVLLMVICA